MCECLRGGDGRTLLVGSWARVPPLKPRARVPTFGPAHVATPVDGGAALTLHTATTAPCPSCAARGRGQESPTHETQPSSPPETTVPLFLNWTKPGTSSLALKPRTSKPRTSKPAPVSRCLLLVDFVQHAPSPLPTAMSLSQHVAQCELSVKRQNEALEAERLAEIVRQNEMDFIRHAETLKRHAEIMSDMSFLNDFI